MKVSRNNGWLNASRKMLEGRQFDSVAVQPPEFENVIQRAGVTEDEAVYSPVVLNWIRTNYRKRYVPERILIALGMMEEA